MRTYTLQASSAFKAEVSLIEAADDADAMLLAASEVLDRAYKKTNLWSQGRITLRDPHGRIVNEMEPK
jgi:hypothetical protein